MLSPEGHFSLRTFSGTPADELSHCLQNINHELRAIHRKLDSVERSAKNNEQRLETIDSLLRTQQPAVHPSDEDQQPQSMRNLRMTAVVALCGLLLLSRRARRTLRSLPITLLLLLQTTAASTILALKGLDLVWGEEQMRERRRELAQRLLVASGVALPLKGFAHLLN